jgi:hypothetical protein
MNGPDARKAALLAAAAATSAPTRPQGLRRAIALGVLSVAFAVGWFESVGGLDHAKGRPLSITAAIAAGSALYSAGLAWLVLGRKGTLARRPSLVLGAALATPIVLVLWMHVFDGTFTEPFSRFGWRCAGHSLVMAALPLASFLLLRKGVEPRAPAALGAGMGAVSGAWAGVLVDLWCPLVNFQHVLVGHVAPILVLVVIGAAIGSVRLGVRAR